MRNIKKGSTLIVAIMVAVILSIIAGGMFTIVNSSISQTKRDLDDSNLFWEAQAGAEYGRHFIETFSCDTIPFFVSDDLINLIKNSNNNVDELVSKNDTDISLTLSIDETTTPHTAILISTASKSGKTKSITYRFNLSRLPGEFPIEDFGVGSFRGYNSITEGQMPHMTDGEYFFGETKIRGEMKFRGYPQFRGDVISGSTQSSTLKYDDGNSGNDNIWDYRDKTLNDFTANLYSCLIKDLHVNGGDRFIGSLEDDKNDDDWNLSYYKIFQGDGDDSDGVNRIKRETLEGIRDDIYSYTFDQIASSSAIDGIQASGNLNSNIYYIAPGTDKILVEFYVDPADNDQYAFIFKGANSDSTLYQNKTKTEWESMPASSRPEIINMTDGDISTVAVADAVGAHRYVGVFGEISGERALVTEYSSVNIVDDIYYSNCKSLVTGTDRIKSELWRRDADGYTDIAKQALDDVVNTTNDVMSILPGANLGTDVNFMANLNGTSLGSGIAVDDNPNGYGVNFSASDGITTLNRFFARGSILIPAEDQFKTGGTVGNSDALICTATLYAPYGLLTTNGAQTFNNPNKLTTANEAVGGNSPWTGKRTSFIVYGKSIFSAIFNLRATSNNLAPGTSPSGPESSSNTDYNNYLDKMPYGIYLSTIKDNRFSTTNYPKIFTPAIGPSIGSLEPIEYSSEKPVYLSWEVSL